jgi:hypothetical protein
MRPLRRGAFAARHWSLLTKSTLYCIQRLRAVSAIWILTGRWGPESKKEGTGTARPVQGRTVAISLGPFSSKVRADHEKYTAQNLTTL